MYRYSREFPYKIIPHITADGEINDIIHNYKDKGKGKGESKGANSGDKEG